MALSTNQIECCTKLANQKLTVDYFETSSIKWRNGIFHRRLNGSLHELYYLDILVEAHVHF